MQCPYCHKTVTNVTNSRSTKDDTQIWRRRQCWHCKAIFTTHEIVDLSHLVVLKKAGLTEMYNHMKLYNGVYKATVSKTTNRLRKVNEVVQLVEHDILFLKKKRVKSEEIGEIVLNRLKRLDTGMFLRFLSYFKDITSEFEMNKELKKYLKS
jgi:transcriptional repressor NrdR